MTHNASPAGGARASRGLSLHAAFPAKDARSTTVSSGGDRYPSFRHSRHHRPQQSLDAPFLAPLATLSDKLLPSTATGGQGLGSTRITGRSPSQSLRATSREPSREREVTEERPATMPKDWTWQDVKVERQRNQQRDRTVMANYTSLAATVQHQSHALNSLQSSLDSTLASAGKLLSQLRDLHQHSSGSLNTLTETTIPDLSQTSETHLAALQRAHVSNSISQLATLKTRIGSARERTTGLQHRLERCAQRAAVEEERERTEMRRHKRRVWAVWGVLATVVIAWVTALVWRGTEIGLEHRIFDYEELAKANLELRSVLESKGLDWALEDEDVLLPDYWTTSEKEPEPLRGRSSAAPTDLQRPLETFHEDVHFAQLDDRLDRLFDFV